MYLQQKMFNTCKAKRYSSISYEVGRALSTENLKESSKGAKFFGLVPLSGYEDAIGAPEGSVLVRLPGPSHYDILQEKVESLEKRLQNSDNRINELEKNAENSDNRINELKNSAQVLEDNIKALQIAPSVIKIVETVRDQEKKVIEHYFPLLFESLKRPSEKQLAHLRKFKDVKKELANFFNDPIVQRLENLIINPTWKSLEEKRNEHVHGAIEEVSEIASTWMKLSSDPKLGLEIVDIAKSVKQLINN